MLATGRLEGRQAWLLDANPDLVGCYETLRDRTDEVIDELARLEQAHLTRGDAFYYEVRDTKFNPRRAAAPGAYAPDLAAMLIYLNRTGFNGLFRLNRRGAFNVPVGRYANPTICDRAHLRQVAAALGDGRVKFEGGSFEVPLAAAGAGDFVYCDPPYAPLSTTASFANYTAAGFGPQDQERLFRLVLGAVNRGASVVLSNSSAPEIVEMYASAEARRAGLVLSLVPARRSINSRAASRGTVDEVLVTTRTALPVARPKPAVAALRRARRTA